MTSKLKCPFCHKQLVKDPGGYYTCYTDNCTVMSAGGNGASGSLSLWLKLIQMCNALGVAKEALKYARQRGLDNTATLFAVGSKADKALEQIRVLEQKG